MGELKRKRGVVLFGSLTAMRSMGMVVGVLGMIALICVFACQQTQAFGHRLQPQARFQQPRP